MSAAGALHAPRTSKSICRYIVRINLTSVESVKRCLPDLVRSRNTSEPTQVLGIDKYMCNTIFFTTKDQKRAVCHQHGTKGKSDSSTDVEPMKSDRLRNRRTVFVADAQFS